jgi:hypothetical protein
MTTNSYKNIWTSEALRELFPDTRTDAFFDALYGDAAEGAYDISLKFVRQTESAQNETAQPEQALMFEFHLTRRPEKCLRCSLTYGLPQVFARHPVIDVKGLIKKIDKQLNGLARCRDWKLGETKEMSDALHVIPLTVYLAPAA